jgi:hypothetical protein
MYTVGVKSGPMAAMRNSKTLSVPQAGREYFDLGKNASYKAARAGEIPVIQVGKKLRVPKVALEKMLTDAAPKKQVAK